MTAEACPRVLCLAVLAACAGTERAPVDIRLAYPSTLVPSQGDVLARPADLAVDERGSVYVSDWQAGRVVVIEPATGTSRFIGREGRGPGELQQPWGLGIAGDTLRVVNTGNLRVEVFTTAGAFVRSDPLSLMARAAPTDFAADGRMAAASYGIQDSALVRVYARDGTSLTGVGELLVPPAGGFDVTAIKDAIAKGDVPEMFRNFTRPLVTPDGGLWAILTAEGAVRRYDTAGRLLWSVPLEAPELPRIKQAFFEQGRALADQPARFTILSYVDDAHVVAGDLWLLLNTPPGEPSVILVLSDRGELLRRVVLPGVEEAGAFAVDAGRRRLYVTPSGDASLLGFELPAW